MKKLFSSLLLVSVLFACNNDKTTDSTESAPVTPGIDNVNGNIPDTTDAIRLNQPLPKDSSGMTDSIR